MAHFEWLDKNMNDVFEKIYDNQNLCKYLYYDSDNPLTEADIIDTKILYTDKLNQKLFPYFFTPDVTEEFKSTLHICFRDFTLSSNTLFKPSKIDFIVVCHKYLWQLDVGDDEVHLRPFAILNELDKTFNRQRTLGLGKNNFQGLKPMQFNTNFFGYVYTLEWVDFT